MMLGFRRVMVGLARLGTDGRLRRARRVLLRAKSVDSR